MVRLETSNCSSATPATSSACSPPNSATSRKPRSTHSSPDRHRHPALPGGLPSLSPGAARHGLVGLAVLDARPPPRRGSFSTAHINTRPAEAGTDAMAQAQQIAELIRSEHLSFAATGDPAGHATTRTDEPPAPTTPRPQLSVIQKNAPASSGVTGVSASWTCPVDSGRPRCACQCRSGPDRAAGFLMAQSVAKSRSADRGHEAGLSPRRGG